MDQRSKIAILGYGVEGKAICDYLIKHEYTHITVCDKNVDLEDELPHGVSVRLGPNYLDGLTDFDIVFRSPGIRYLEPLIQSAVAKGLEVTSSTAFFLDQAPCPVIGVTGTKGKGTTCTLIAEMLKASGKKVHLGGNIGDPAVNFIDKAKGSDIVVLELSSFQLQDLRKKVSYAILLNTTSDHLDYHADTGEYMQAKEALLAHQDSEGVAILNKDYDYIKYYIPLVKGKRCMVSCKEVVGDGAFVKDGEIIFAEGGEQEVIGKTSDIALIGSHNYENVLPAVVMAKEFGVGNKEILKVIKEFKGLPHRLEFVREFKEVKFYNDSFSTTSETSMAAVDSFDVPTVLIAGGSDKGLDYGNWALKILTEVSLKVVILVGETADKMEEEIIEAEKKLGEAEGSPTKILRRGTLEEAVLDGYAQAEDGGVVVMSPAAASFDKFENYKKRGEAFRSFVKKLQ